MHIDIGAHMDWALAADARQDCRPVLLSATPAWLDMYHGAYHPGLSFLESAAPFCREREVARAMMQQERTTTRATHHHGPPDDLDLGETHRGAAATKVHRVLVFPAEDDLDLGVTCATVLLTMTKQGTNAAGEHMCARAQVASAASLCYFAALHAHTAVTQHRLNQTDPLLSSRVIVNAEYEALLVRARATAAAQAAARGLDASAVEPVVPPQPEFPPPYLQLQPAFPAELEDTLGPQLIETWGFLMSESAVC